MPDTNCKRRGPGFSGKPPLETSKSYRGLYENDILRLKSFKNLSNYIQVDDVTDVSRLEGFTLDKYILTKENICYEEHKQPCTACIGLLSVAKQILDEGFIKLNKAFAMSTPGVKYKAKDAKRKLLQMPLAALKIKESKTYTIYLVSKDTNLQLTRSLLKRKDWGSQNTGMQMSASLVKELLSATESDAERERLTYGIVKSSGLSHTKLRQLYGFENLKRRQDKVENALREMREIREAVASIASIQEKAVLQSFGIEVESDEDLEHDESETDTDADGEEDSALNAVENTSLSELIPATLNESEDRLVSETDSAFNVSEIGLAPSQNTDIGDMAHQFSLSKEITESACYQNSHQLMDILKSCELNWFSFVEVIKEKMKDYSKEAIDQLLLDFSGQLHLFNLDEREELIIEQSRQAFLLARRLDENNSDADDEAVLSEAEEMEVDWGNIHDPLQKEAQSAIIQKIRNLGLGAKRKAAKKIAEERFLRRRRGKNVSKILKECPDIGQTIENYVKSAGAGADSWRRTGVLTFDGNRKVQKKPTFSRIKEHLEMVYNREFGYGTVVELCVARNKRRKSSTRYRGLARVTCRRARKGFTLRYNPDQHWSAAFYRSLDALHLRDGNDILNINRDDQAGFRLDTLATHNKRATLCIAEEVPLTTKSDYVNKYPSTLQTTSYNFLGTGTTAEICAGVVKAVPLHSKNPAQHFNDLNEIETYLDVQPAFFNCLSGERKTKVCVRVDGGHDEGPTHKEVQFWWTCYHLDKASRVLILTTRDSGSSNKNRVELQNGCLALAHSNLFIPSTLNGSCLDSQSGNVDEGKLKQNLSDAIDVYISRVNKCPCADTVVHLYKGTESSEIQGLRTMVKTFLKGKPSLKEKHKEEYPKEYQRIEDVWNLRARHLVPGLPDKYVFHLTCCYQDECIHPLCKDGRPAVEPTWYPGGPPLSFTPLPVPDPKR